jgi:activator of HSP90 ATPase
MPPAIQQHVSFRASPKTLFDLYINSKKHTAATGAPATIGRTPGSKWNAFGGKIGGTTLLVQPDQLIVQTWRAKFWKKEDLSILTIKFTKVTGGARVDMVHAGVPQYDQKGVRAGWRKYYWKPWKKFLAAT